MYGLYLVVKHIIDGNYLIMLCTAVVLSRWDSINILNFRMKLMSHSASGLRISRSHDRHTITFSPLKYSVVWIINEEGSLM